MTAHSRVALLPLRGEHSPLLATALAMYKAHLQQTPDPQTPLLLEALNEMQQGFETAMAAQYPESAERPWMFGR